MDSPPVFAALIAGLFSFLSPCVLPLVPGYVSMLSGVGVEQLRQGQAPRRTLLWTSLAFVIGFSVVFIAFGASASAVGQFLVKNKALMAPLAGAFIILFGLHLVGWLSRIPIGTGLVLGGLLAAAGVAGLIRPGLLVGLWEPTQLISIALVLLVGPYFSKWMNRDVHLQNVGRQPGAAGGFLLGFAFAFGWTPCIGPILASVLLLAANQETLGQGVFLLSAYSLGLAVPFLLTALGINRFLRFYQRFRRHLHTVEVASGVLLILVGGLVFLDRLTWLADKFAFLNDFVLWLENTFLSKSAAP
jgi:cytochrome c-type biogenesis protein